MHDMDQFIVVYFVRLQKQKRKMTFVYIKRPIYKPNLITMFLVLSSKLKQWKILKNLEDYNTNDYFSDIFKSSIKLFEMGQGGEDELLNILIMALV